MNRCMKQTGNQPGAYMPCIKWARQTHAEALELMGDYRRGHYAKAIYQALAECLPKLRQKSDWRTIPR